MDLDSLVLQFQQKDYKAFEKLYQMYHKSMHGVIYSIVRNKETAEEVMQDVFIKAWNNAESYSPEKGRIFTWLLNISRNAAIDKTRSKAFNNQKENHNSNFFVDIIEADVNLDANLDVAYIKNLLQTLKKTCIALIELLYFKGFTQKEASEELDIPLGTVKTNNRKCISELRNKITD